METLFAEPTTIFYIKKNIEEDNLVNMSICSEKVNSVEDFLFFMDIFNTHYKFDQGTFPHPVEQIIKSCVFGKVKFSEDTLKLIKEKMEIQEKI